MYFMYTRAHTYNHVSIYTNGVLPIVCGASARPAPPGSLLRRRYSTASTLHREHQNIALFIIIIKIIVIILTKPTYRYKAPG